jgi:hypothetical protein
MEHNIIAVLLQAKADDQRRRAAQLGVAPAALFVLIILICLAAAIGIVLLYAASRPDYPG